MKMKMHDQEVVADRQALDSVQKEADDQKTESLEEYMARVVEDVTPEQIQKMQDKYLNKLSILDKKIGGDGKDFYSISNIATTAASNTRSKEPIVTYFLYSINSFHIGIDER